MYLCLVIEQTDIVSVALNYFVFQNIAWKIEDLKTAEDESAKKSIFDFEAHMDEKL